MEGPFWFGKARWRDGEEQFHYLSNSYTVVTSSASTSGQPPLEQVSFVPPLVTLLLLRQYDAAANCSKSCRFAKVEESMAIDLISLGTSVG